MSRRAIALAAVALAAASAAPAAAQETFCERLPASLTAPGPYRIEGAEPHVYKRAGGTELRLHVVRPAAPVAAATTAAIVLYSNGGWMFDRPENQLPLARDLAARGLTVIVPDIRTWCHDRTGIVEQVADANAAFRWVRAHAAELGIDLRRIAAAGGSAAGHMALSTAMFPEVGLDGSATARPDLLLLFFPCVDPTSEIEQEVSAPAIGERGAEVSPLLYLRNDLPPMLIVQGTDDPLYQDVNRFCTEARAAGNICDYAEYQDAEHGFFRPGDEHYEAAFARLEKFLAEAAYLSSAR